MDTTDFYTDLGDLGDAQFLYALYLCTAMHGQTVTRDMVVDTAALGKAIDLGLVSEQYVKEKDAEYSVILNLSSEAKKIAVKIVVDRIWEWIDRTVDESIYNLVPWSAAELKQRFAEIPAVAKPLAWMLIEYARYDAAMCRYAGDEPPFACLHYRTMVHFAYCRLREEGIDVHLPWYWYRDGMMIEPEWIVRITNGIVKWRCDETCENCGMEGRCRFYDRSVVDRDAAEGSTDTPLENATPRTRETLEPPQL